MISHPVVLLIQNLVGNSCAKQVSKINLPPEVGTYKTQNQGVEFFLRIEIQKVKTQNILIGLFLAKLLEYVGIPCFESGGLPGLEADL